MRWRQFVPLLEALPQLRSAALDRHGRLAWISSSTAALYGVPQKDLIGVRVEDHWPLGFEAAWKLTEEARISAKVSVNVDVTNGVNGAAMWLRCTRLPTRGGVVLAVGEDVTAELKLAALQMRLAPIRRTRSVDRALAGFVRDTLSPSLTQRVGQLLAGIPPTPD